MTGRERSLDLVLTGGRVLTMDPALGDALESVERPVTAVGVSAGRIVAVGPASELERMIGPRTRRIELGGRTLVPGFQDAHVHPVMAGLSLTRLPLNDLPVDAAGYLEAIRAYAQRHPDLPWVSGDGWAMAAFPGGTPTREALDAAVPDRPAFFGNRDGHGAWANSRALSFAGITAATDDPAHGRIERDASGNPQGTLHEGAMDLVGRFMPAPSHDDIVRGLGLAQAHLHGYGITAWQDAWVTPTDLAAYRAFAERGLLTARVVACQWWDREQGLEQIDGFRAGRRLGTIGRLTSSTIKIMLDGVAENFTAAMLEPYLDSSGRSTTNRGLSFVDPALLRPAVTRLDREGFQVHFHALGDRAVRDGLDAIEAALRSNGPSGRRHHLAHLQQLGVVQLGHHLESAGA